MGYSSDQTLEGKYTPSEEKTDVYIEFLNSFRKISKHEGKQEAIKAFRDIIRERIQKCRCERVKQELLSVSELIRWL